MASQTIEEQKILIRAILKKYDRNNDGFLERGQVRSAMDDVYDAYSTVCYIFCDDDVQALIEQCDPNEDDRIDLEEFLDLL